MKAIEKESNLSKVLQQLENEEQLESLHYLALKLPEFTASIRVMEDKLAFIGSVLDDKESLRALGEEVEEKVERLHLNQEHFDAMIQMVHLLPRLVPMMQKLDEVATFASDVLADKESMEYAMSSLNDIVPIEKGIDILKETNQQFMKDQRTPNMSVFGMYRLLKDPMIQNGFKYIETLLDVIKKK